MVHFSGADGDLLEPLEMAGRGVKTDQRREKKLAFFG